MQYEQKTTEKKRELYLFRTVCGVRGSFAILLKCKQRQHQRAVDIYYHHTERLRKKDFASRTRHARKGVLQTINKRFQQYRIGGY